MNEILRKTLHLVYTARRKMPAHYTSEGERIQTFCIDFEPLSAEIDYEMPAEAWGSIDGFFWVLPIGHRSSIEKSVKCRACYEKEAI
ncbi:MAG: hypothetical protein PF572_06800 [Patescibacteria group bacterium]|jgi:hypothetical protein|nr:hypothetical protein [Patescibacteria group bacterium]